MMEREILLGLEVTKLGDVDDGSPFRMTVDVVEGDKVIRFQMVAASYTRRERDGEDLMLAAGFNREKGDAMGRLDMEFADKVEEHARWLFREQVRVLHGDEGVAFLERDE